MSRITRIICDLWKGLTRTPVPFLTDHNAAPQDRAAQEGLDAAAQKCSTAAQQAVTDTMALHARVTSLDVGTGSTMMPVALVAGFLWAVAGRLIAWWTGRILSEV